MTSQSDMPEPPIEGVMVTPLNQFPNLKGDVYHGMKSGSPGFEGFGEAYFTTILPGQVKGWHKHLRMTMNLVVPSGCARFVIHDDREDSPSRGQFYPVELSLENYCRLTIAPGLWTAFKGLSPDTSLILNISSILYDDEEVVRVELDRFVYDWGAG